MQWILTNGQQINDDLGTRIPANVALTGHSNGEQTSHWSQKVQSHGKKGLVRDQGKRKYCPVNGSNAPDSSVGEEKFVPRHKTSLSQAPILSMGYFCSAVTLASISR